MLISELFFFFFFRGGGLFLCVRILLISVFAGGSVNLSVTVISIFSSDSQQESKWAKC